MSEGNRKQRGKRGHAKAGSSGSPGTAQTHPRRPASGASLSGRPKLFSLPSLCIMLALAALTAAVYAPLRHSEFVAFDDPAYVSENPHIAGGVTWQGVSWAFSSGYAANWHPLTWLSHMIDVEFFGLNAGPHHLVSLFLHIANTLLLFGLLCRMTGAMGRSAFVAGLFSVHPLHVESVAWVAERKDVLSALFWILTLWAYAAYARRPGRPRYLLVLVLLGLGLMSKPMLVTVPFVLLLLDVWPLGRVSHPAKWAVWRRMILEKIPLFALAAVSCVVTLMVQQRGGAVAEFQAIPLKLRLENALVSYIAYLGKMIWPDRLAVLYPLPHSIPLPAVAAAVLLMAGISYLVVRAAGRRPYLAVGWFLYLGTLVPVIGLVQVGLQSMADRYTYIPLIGLFVMAAWGIPDLLVRFPYRRHLLPVSASLLILGFAITARAQVRHWKDSVALWGNVTQIALGMEKAQAHLALGNILREQGRMDEATANYAEAIRQSPDLAEAHYGLGLILAGRGKLDEAIASYSDAVRLKPDYAAARVNLGRALASQGKAGPASVQFAEAVRLEPGSADVQRDLGRSLLNQGKAAEASAALTEAVRLKPDFAEAHSDLGFALAIQGKRPEAMDHLTQALRLKPDLAEAHLNLGTALSREGKPGEALAHFSEAARLRPGYELARQNLGIALLGAGRIEEAIREFKEVLRINPGNSEIRRTLEELSRQGKQPEPDPMHPL